MEKVTDYKQLKTGNYILFKTKKEEAVLKITAIKTSIFSSAVDIECKIGKIETVITSGDIRSGHVFLTKSKKAYYKSL